MDKNIHLIQDPPPGTRRVKFCGDTIEFKLFLPRARNGTAWVRTNLGQARIIRREIIRQIENDETPLGRAWFDIPMKRVDERSFAVRLPLDESGHFEAKCFFLPEEQMTPIWPHGPNTTINVDSADSSGANIIYNAFVRQFGPNKSGVKTLASAEKEIVASLDKSGYTVIPPSGTFRDLINELDFILGELGCRILMLLPIHPTPTTYGRMGRFGSPYAALSFTAVDPALAQFDPHATPLEQFTELVDAVHRRYARIFIDIAINHTGWAAGLHESHPQWLARSSSGKIEVPGAWGISWEDLTKLDYTQKDLWTYMANVFLTWCNRGVDGFRCDAGYMIPVEAWKYMIAKVRAQFPDTVFLLEGLGGKISVTRDLLNTANLNWAYSELFQNYDRSQIENYLPEAIDISIADGTTVHLAETHDNPRLASRSETYARMRTALCALLSFRGAFGFANGVEWFATEKINVHDSPSLNWGAKNNQVDLIRRLNDLMKIHPSFYGETEMKMVQEEGGNHIVLTRRHMASGETLLVVANLDDSNQTLASWNPARTGMPGPNFIDLLSDAAVNVQASDGIQRYLLDPGQVLCLTCQEKDLESLQKLPVQSFRIPDKIENQRLRAKVFEVFTFYNGTGDLEDFDVDKAAKKLKADPVSFCKNLNTFSRESRVIAWRWPRDLRREVMIPPGHFLIVQAEAAFRAVIIDQKVTTACEESIENEDGLHFALFAPLALFAPSKPQKSPQKRTLNLSVYLSDGKKHYQAPLLVLPRSEHVRIKHTFRRSELLRNDFTFLATNGRGAMLRIPVNWAKMNSRYDSLLAGNMSTEFPEDRRIMFARCRMWLVFQGYSQDVNTNCLEAFTAEKSSGGNWCYQIPTGQGEHVILTLGLKMIVGKNAVQMTFCRQSAKAADGRLDDNKPVQLILRPDIENRNFHETTKAYLGPEEHWPQCVKYNQKEFLFTPDSEHHLRIKLSEGSFEWEPEWQYMVYRAVDAERGLDPDSDLFSPGYFKIFLKGGQQITLTAEISNKPDFDPLITAPTQLTVSSTQPPEFDDRSLKKPLEILTDALDDFLVSRGTLKSVIAGYPWFLDWGRDALIFTRGMIAAQKFREVRAILKQFGQFEQQGTLPNMIRGNDAANRDTSDAPLWFILACDDLIRAEKSDDFLDTKCAERSIRQIITSIGQSYLKGTPNGIRTDSESALVFSPAHFTWMDTDHPAGSPRQGYPIEIQALWYAALGMLARIDRPENQHKWKHLKNQVRTSVSDLFRYGDLGFFSDCLHASSGQPAAQSAADDALRPNQILSITLGLVKEEQICRHILAACEELLVPGAIRSLADRHVDHPIEIVHNGNMINDPHHPYQGKYIGDEDTQRKPAYHNGTAWSWPFPSFCEAWALTYGEQGKETAFSWLSSGAYLLGIGCLGHIPEILDGDAPHTPRGCDAQAWGVSELLRVWLNLDQTPHLMDGSHDIKK
jgi:predicted glycogen debranching enzyme